MAILLQARTPVELEALFSSETEDVYNLLIILVKSGWIIQRWFNRHRSGDDGVTGVHGSSKQDESLHSLYSMKRELNDDLTAWCTKG